MATTENTRKRTYEENVALALKRPAQNQGEQISLAFADDRPVKPSKLPTKAHDKPLPAALPPKPNTKPLTVRQDRLLKTAAEIAGERPEDIDLAYNHSILCQVGLPRSKVNGTSFERRSGGVALLVEAGKLWDGNQFVQQPIPYGATPRLILAWVNTHAVRYSTPEIPIGDSQSDFLQKLGKQVTGGKNGSLTSFKTQTQALSVCRLSLGFNSNGQANTYTGQPIEKFSAWLSPIDSQPSLWPKTIMLSQTYYETLKEHAVPIDLRAFMSLKGSALAMDIYTMLAQRLYRINGRPLILHWASLREQFGQEYLKGLDPDKNFKKTFLPALQSALAVYPKANVKLVQGGLLLTKSPPPIPIRG